VIGDMISPFKAVVGGGYKAVEKRLQARDPSALLAAAERPQDAGTTDQAGRCHRRLLGGHAAGRDSPKRRRPASSAGRAD
jgi:hypothetical protein